LDHAALLVESLEALLPSLAARGWVAGPIRSFPKEGTREAYVRLADSGPDPAGQARRGRLLLLEPAGAGPYARALAERGPGLHHLGLAAPDLSAFAATLPASGWFVHPYSLRAGTQLKDLWLFRPGIPALIEVFESPAADGPPSLIRAVELPLAEGLAALLQRLGCDSLLPAAGGEAVLQTVSGRITAGELLRGPR